MKNGLQSLPSSRSRTMAALDAQTSMKRLRNAYHKISGRIILNEKIYAKRIASFVAADPPPHDDDVPQMFRGVLEMHRRLTWRETALGSIEMAYEELASRLKPYERILEPTLESIPYRVNRSSRRMLLVLTCKTLRDVCHRKCDPRSDGVHEQFLRELNSIIASYDTPLAGDGSYSRVPSDGGLMSVLNYSQKDLLMSLISRRQSFNFSKQPRTSRSQLESLSTEAIGARLATFTAETDNMKTRAKMSLELIQKHSRSSARLQSSMASSMEHALYLASRTALHSTSALYAACEEINDMVDIMEKRKK